MINIILVAISVLMLLAAIPPVLPKSYYVLFHIIIFLTAISLVYKSKKLSKKGWLWTMSVIAILFNPIFFIKPGHVDSILIYTIAICLFVTSLLKMKANNDPLTLNIGLMKITIGVLSFAIIIIVALYYYFLKQRFLP